MADSPPVEVAADASGSAEATETADDAHFTSPYGFHKPSTRWTESSEQGGWKWVRRLSVNHPVIKQGQDVTHMCIKPMPDGRANRLRGGKFIKTKDRKLSQLISSGGHFTRGAHKDENTTHSAQIKMWTCRGIRCFRTGQKECTGGRRNIYG
jgi:hypothetical protein